ncbi:hypothetical protein E5D57_005300 [Metarhizium anisopliae]|nr:hypothetical protein E5D57_005300 [Metarhizium anisopliae]
MITAGFVAVALAGLASLAENAAPFQAPDTYSLNGAGLANGFDGLAARDDECLTSQVACGTGFCMPRGGSCCDRVRGTYCDIGFYCYPQGCCPSGKVCRGSPTDGCASGKQECGSVCIAGSSICCNPGASSGNVWCEYPKTCGAGGKPRLTRQTSLLPREWDTLLPPGSPPPPQGYYNASPPPGQYSPSMATGQVSSPTGTYSTSTDPRTGAPTVSPVGFATVSATPPTPPPASQGRNGNEKPVVYEMSAKPGDDHRGNIHELA